MTAGRSKDESFVSIYTRHNNNKRARPQWEGLRGKIHRLAKGAARKEESSGEMVLEWKIQLAPCRGLYDSFGVQPRSSACLTPRYIDRASVE